MARRRVPTQRDYPRTARVNELLREILAEELERLDEDALQLVTVVGVTCEPDLRHATVYFDGPEGEAGDAAVAEALGEVRHLLQAAIGRQARLKRTPELRFAPDPAVRQGERIDALLHDLQVHDLQVHDLQSHDLQSHDLHGGGSGREQG